MGFDKNRRSEEKLENPEKAETVPIEDKSITDTTPETASTNSKASTLTCLTTILEEINSPEEEWPKEVYRKVLARFGQMPRTGWSRMLSVFCSKFKVQLTLEELKNRALKILKKPTWKRIVQY